MPWKASPGAVNGGAALHGKPGDLVIVMTFAVVDDKEARKHKAKIVHVNAKNEIVPF
jgi:aspartate 1-decarboxylase